ncbi:hypothetical protein Lser_V15G33303 [Lactuca serriola]
MAGSMPYPDRPGEPDCIFYLRTGLCGYGNICRFNHLTHIGQANQLQLGGELPERVGEPDCVSFLKTGTCKYGSTYKYNHPRDRRGVGPVVLNMVGLLNLIYQLFFLILKELGPHKGSLSLVSSSSIYGGPGSIYGGLDNIEQPIPLVLLICPNGLGTKCRYFMNIGNCRYHHPKEKIAHLAASSLL